jgi:hypothetical protein
MWEQSGSDPGCSLILSHILYHFSNFGSMPCKLILSRQSAA